MGGNEGEIKKRDGPCRRTLIGSGLDGLKVGIAVAQAASARRTTERLMVARMVDGWVAGSVVGGIPFV